jgi:hypothetical protein
LVHEHPTRGARAPAVKRRDRRKDCLSCPLRDPDVRRPHLSRSRHQREKQRPHPAAPSARRISYSLRAGTFRRHVENEVGDHVNIEPRCGDRDVRHAEHVTSSLGKFQVVESGPGTFIIWLGFDSPADCAAWHAAADSMHGFRPATPRALARNVPRLRKARKLSQDDLWQCASTTSLPIAVAPYLPPQVGFWRSASDRDSTYRSMGRAQVT